MLHKLQILLQDPEAP